PDQTHAPAVEDERQLGVGVAVREHARMEATALEGDQGLAGAARGGIGQGFQSHHSLHSPDEPKRYHGKNNRGSDADNTGVAPARADAYASTWSMRKSLGKIPGSAAIPAPLAGVLAGCVGDISEWAQERGPSGSMPGDNPGSGPGGPGTVAGG